MANEFARRMRKDLTRAEQNLWWELRDYKKQGFHFRRQVPLGRYIVDFACHSARLVVEVDGDQHGYPRNMERDRERTRWLESQGYEVIRAWNDEVLKNMDGVLHEIDQCLRASRFRTPHPAASKPIPGIALKAATLPTRGREARLHTTLSSQNKLKD